MNRKIKVLIGEDDVFIAEYLRKVLLSFEYNVVGVFSNKQDILDGLANLNPDIALLDIKMENQYTGIEIGEFINSEIHIPYIFISAHSDKKTLEKALLGKPAAYILKPINEQEVNIAIRLAIEKFANSTEKNVFVVKEGYKHFKILVKDILFVKADNIYSEIYTPKNKTVVRKALKQLVEELNYNNIIQVHRSFFVNIEHITQIKGNIIYLNHYEIPLSRKFKDEVSKLFLERTSFS
ncbi:MAG: response regulator transcription factor [Bacteroidales bacterium]|nr:response regulator transcription factor [Bacteroidales bacterium]